MNDESTELTELLKQDEHRNLNLYFDISSDFVRQGINEQNTAITNITVYFGDSSCKKRAEAEGECIGKSLHVKSLDLILPPDGSAACVIPFCKGLALNRTKASFPFSYGCRVSSRSINLSGQKFGPGSLSAIIKVLLRPSSQLEELNLDGCSWFDNSYSQFDDGPLGVLGERLFLARNSTLKSLRLWIWCLEDFFSKLKGNDCFLEYIGLRGNYSINDDVISEFLRLLQPGTVAVAFLAKFGI